MKTRLALAAATVAMVALAPTAPTRAQGLAGPYLAGVSASYDNDYAAAARFFAEAAERDPDNINLLQDTAINAVIAGDFDTALPVASKLQDLGADVQLSGLILIADAMGRQDYAGALAVLESAGDEVNPLLGNLLRGWIEAGLGDIDAATQTLQSVSGDTAFGALAKYHQSLILGLVGNFDGAVSILEGDAETGPLRVNRASARVHAQMLMQLDRKDDALAVIGTALEEEPDLELFDLRESIQSGQDVSFDHVRSVEDGAGEVLLTLASALGPESFALFYGRLAQIVRPDYVEAYLFTADLFSTKEQYALAVADYEKIPAESIDYRSARIGRANAFADAGDAEGAIAAMSAITEEWPDDGYALISLGDLYRYEERFEEATATYTQALGLVERPRPGDWRTHYVRGISYERTDNWEAAEADFRKALELRPDQPLVLNYLGYSLVEMDMKIDEARDMIERAVAGDPDNGYITDSLGWVLYKIGEYDAAVPHMERAAELLPSDPIINDHLGDVYWTVGRKTEAVFQWKRALSFGPEEAEADRIRRKLDVGLDVVRAEEAEAEAASTQN